MCTPIKRTCGFRCLLPYLGSSISSGIVMAAGDLLAQTYLEKVDDIDDINWDRTMKFGAIGLLFVGPVVAHWRGLSSRFIGRRTPALEAALSRTLAAQMYLAPALNLGLLSIISCIKAEDVNNKIIEDGIKEKIIPIMKTNYMIWPIAQSLTALMFPPAVRSALLSLIGIPWSCFVSSELMAEKQDPNDKNAKAKGKGQPAKDPKGQKGKDQKGKNQKKK